MSYNVANWLVCDRSIDGRRAPAPKPEKEKNAVVDVIAAHKPDVLGLIEIGTQADLSDLRARLKARGLDYPHEEWHEGADTERHVALLSRFPIVRRDSKNKITFPLAGRPQAIQRGILDVTIEPSPGYRLRLIGLHLKSRRPVPEVDQAALRAKEAWYVRDYIDRILKADPDTNLLVYGDLNDTKNEYPIREILGPASSPAKLTDLPLSDRNGERWTHYYKVADEYARIDYFMASRGLRPEIHSKKSGIDSSPDWHLASDHRAIFTTIECSDR